MTSFQKSCFLLKFESREVRNWLYKETNSLCKNNSKGVLRCLDCLCLQQQGCMYSLGGYLPRFELINNREISTFLSSHDRWLSNREMTLCVGKSVNMYFTTYSTQAWHLLWWSIQLCLLLFLHNRHLLLHHGCLIPSPTWTWYCMNSQPVKFTPHPEKHIAAAIFISWIMKLLWRFNHREIPLHHLHNWIWLNKQAVHLWLSMRMKTQSAQLPVCSL